MSTYPATSRQSPSKRWCSRPTLDVAVRASSGRMTSMTWPVVDRLFLRRVSTTTESAVEGAAITAGLARPLLLLFVLPLVLQLLLR